MIRVCEKKHAKHLKNGIDKRLIPKDNLYKRVKMFVRNSVHMYEWIAVYESMNFRILVDINYNCYL